MIAFFNPKPKFTNVIGLSKLQLRKKNPWFWDLMLLSKIYELTYWFDLNGKKLFGIICHFKIEIAFKCELFFWRFSCSRWKILFGGGENS